MEKIFGPLRAQIKKMGTAHIAKKSGISRQHVYNVLKRDVDLSLATFLKLARAAKMEIFIEVEAPPRAKR